MLSPTILKQATATGLGWVSAPEIDQYGLSNALKLAARRAVKQVLASKIRFDEVVIDGTVNFLADTPLDNYVTLLKKADLLVKEVSAASIIAKVARDNYMIKLAEKYPVYHFDQHVGYGTALHRQALEQYGPCPEHRRSFRPVREIAAQFETNLDKKADSLSINSTELRNATTRGQTAEQIIIDFLQNQGHQIIAHNFKTKTYEIDIISTLVDKIYFTEVKYRKAPQHGSSLAQITTKKHQQMRFAAESFLRAHAEYQSYQPILAAASVSGEDFQLQDWFQLED